MRRPPAADPAVPAANYTMADHATDVIGLLDTLDLRDPIPVGHSFGGLLVLYMAVQFPERFPRIGVLDAAMLRSRRPRPWPAAEAGPRPPQPDLSFCLGGVPGRWSSRRRSSSSHGTRVSRVTSGPIALRTPTAASSRGPGRRRSAR